MYTQQDLSLVAEGMVVYDRDGAHVGTVKAFRAGEGAKGGTSVDTITMAEVVADALKRDVELPTVLYARLYEEGFVCVNRGLLRKDVIVFPGQISHISGESINLNVDLDELTRI